MKRLVVLGILLFSASLLAAQQTNAYSPSVSNADTISKAMSAGPPDIAKDAAIVEPTAGGQMKELRPGKNGWVCMAQPMRMCLDKQWQNWADAWANRKDPNITAVGIGYMLTGDEGASNTDPYATAPTPDNQWVVAPAHVMVLTPDTKQLDELSTDPHNGGPWVMWKGTKYAHIMVPVAAMPKGAPSNTATK